MESNRQAALLNLLEWIHGHYVMKRHGKLVISVHQFVSISRWPQATLERKKPKPVFCSQDVIRRQFFEIPKPNKQGWASGAAAGTIMIGWFWGKLLVIYLLSSKFLLEKTQVEATKQQRISNDVVWKFPSMYTNSLVNATFGLWKKLC